MTTLSIPDRLRKLLQDQLACGEHHIAVDELHIGKWCNANVLRIRAGDRVYAVKEFHARHPLVRFTLGRLMIRRELKALRRLAGLPGIPSESHRLDAYALILDYIPGHTLSELHRNAEHVPPAFFEEMEKRIRAMHRMDYAHLDLRNLGNTIRDDNGDPWFIDFQSSVCTRRLPRIVRRQMEDTDRSAVIKGLQRLCKAPLTEEQIRFLNRFEHTRKFWKFKGYWLSKTLKRGKGAPQGHRVQESIERSA